MSRLNMRPSLQTIDPTWHATSRIAHGVVSFGRLQFQVIAIYAMTGQTIEAKQFNNELLKQSILASQHLPLPCLMIGDFNGDPTLWDAFRPLHAVGYEDLATMH